MKRLCRQWGKDMNFDKELDTRGLNCPLPILRTKKSLNDMQSGQLLKVRATDPALHAAADALSAATDCCLLLPPPLLCRNAVRTQPANGRGFLSAAAFSKPLK
jgi:tRNA 2-thiouridine synthesizing protein A